MNHDQDVVKEIKKIRFDGFKGNIDDSEIDTIRKDWFKHVLLNIEKLYCIAEESRKENIVSLQMLRDDIKELTGKISNKMHNEGKKKILVKTNMNPAIKVAVYGALAGFIGGFIVVLILYVVNKFI